MTTHDKPSPASQPVGLTVEALLQAIENRIHRAQDLGFADEVMTMKSIIAYAREIAARNRSLQKDSDSKGDADARDAARYRWLLQRWVMRNTPAGLLFSTPEGFPYVQLRGDINAAIDTAIAQSVEAKP